MTWPSYEDIKRIRAAIYATHGEDRLSNRTIIEINHDTGIFSLGNSVSMQILAQVLSSGASLQEKQDRLVRVSGFRLLAERHHSEKMTIARYDGKTVITLDKSIR